MTQVPLHIKKHVDRIIREYELLYRQGHKIALQFLRGNRLYSGLETTKYYLDSLKDFRKLLNKPEGDFFTGTDFEIQRRIYETICEYYKHLSPEAICRITHDVVCQGQLEDAIRAAKKNNTTFKDAVQISRFIANGCILNWGECDERVNRKIFKLVKTEESFEDLLTHAEKNPLVEITSEGNMTYTKIRVAFQFLEIPAMYRKKSRYREYRNFWEAPHTVEEFDLDHTIFNMWNDITETGIYYVYIPKVN